MSSASLIDYLCEKVHSFSSKMWGDSVHPSGTSFLMSGNNYSQPYDLSAMLAEVRDRSDYQIAINPSYQTLPFLRFAPGIFGGLKQLKGLDKPNYFMNYSNEKGFSPFLFNFVSDSSHIKRSSFDNSVIFPPFQLPIPVIESLFNEIHFMSEQAEIMDKQRVDNPQVTKMSLDIGHLSSKEKSQSEKKNCDVSRTMRLNIELTHRKTKEMSKRSKKRRRRQKKNEQLSINNSISASDDDDASSECLPPVTDNVYFLSKSPDYDCTLSIAHTVQLCPPNSSFIAVSSDSEDDPEWETFDEIELSAANNVDSSKGSPTSNSSPLKSENLKSNCFRPSDCSIKVSSVISFVVPEDDTSDDDSDWDTCESGTFTDNIGIEFSGLYFNNLCTPHSFYKSESNSDSSSEEECEEILQLRAVLLEANNKWNKLDEEVQKPKTASKVTFAPDENLAVVFPVEAFDRKGEWEMYATERLRFRRRIDELEKVISPCLTAEHRSKIFKKLVEPGL